MTIYENFSEIAINEIKEETKDLLENHLKSDLKGI